MTLENVKVGDVVVLQFETGARERRTIRQLSKVVKVTDTMIHLPFNYVHRKSDGLGRFSSDRHRSISTDPELIAQVQADEDRKKAERADYQAQRAALKATPHWQAADSLRCLLCSDLTADEIMAKWSCVTIQDALKALGDRKPHTDA